MSASPSLRAQQLGFAYDTTSIFESLDFHLGPGWCGLVGANGLGKTTLLRLMLGELKPGHGALVAEPKGARIAWCPQRVEALDDTIRAFSEANDGTARRLVGRLKLDVSQLERWPTMSPGERKRWQLAAALHQEPDVLLLDEPGNHLDSEGLRSLRGALKGFNGVGVLVSHDRALLDDVTDSTLRLVPGGARLYRHPYSAARALWLEEEEGQREQHRETKRRLEKEESKLEAKRRALASASKMRSTAARMRNRYDSEARSLGADFRAEQAETSHAATLRRVTRSAERVRAELENVHVVDEAGQALFVRYEPCPKPAVVQHGGIQLGRDGRLWLKGPNGSGKTTLLKRLLAEGCTVPEERRLVLPQELTLEASQADLETAKALPNDERGRVLQLVHALGVEPDRLLSSPAPSPGEGRKLRLALGLGRHAWLLVLDEPTNHLDLPAIERLGAALKEYPGALLIVTHDAQLGQGLEADELTLPA
ncbi:MAG: ABC-F family ATP-binding cassette domain-containing protein [Myxococcaceae bacterium]|nr:ABC-F family ATP-binding cassette domain-containing protein [Myxococcaceae bacterium]